MSDKVEQDLDSYQASHTELSVMLAVLREDAVKHFRTGQKPKAKADFVQGVTDALYVDHRYVLTDSALKPLLNSIPLVNPQAFEDSLDQIIEHVLGKARRR